MALPLLETENSPLPHELCLSSPAYVSLRHLGYHMKTKKKNGRASIDELKTRRNLTARL